jgi:hypothetical protein
MFSWVPFFTEVGQILAKNYDKASLAKLTYDVYPASGLVALITGDKFQILDPFVFIARMNGNDREAKRIELCQNVARALDVKAPVPSDFAGIPTFQNNALWFCNPANEFNEVCKDSDIDAHWTLLSEIIDGQITDKSFRRSLKVKSVAIAKLTQIMYLIRPDLYLPCDQNTLTLSAELGGSYKFKNNKDLHFNDYLDYVTFLKSKFPGKSLPEISYEARQKSQTEDSAVSQVKPTFFVAGSYISPTGSNDQKLMAREMIDTGVWQCDFSLDDNKGNYSRKIMSRVKPGDYIALKASYTKSKTTSIMRVDAIGKVTKNPQDGKFIGVDWLWQGPSFEIEGTSYQKTIEEVQSDSNIEKIFWPVLSGIQKSVLSKPMHSANAPTNIIYYGPPGTGKTYAILNKMKEYQQVSGGPGSDVAEWVKDKTWWEVIAASMIEIGGRVQVGQIASHDLVRIKTGFSSTKTPKATIWGQLQLHTVRNSTTVAYEKRNAPLCVDKTGDSKWFLTGDWEEQLEYLREDLRELRSGGKPGEVKNLYEFVTFHQTYGYENFVEGIRPVVNEEGSVSYEVKNGVFKELCIRAANDPANRYAIFIDEINRGNISKIFGELITLIEPDKRAGSPNQLHARLPSSSDILIVPSNLDIYGTMNSVDRSVALVDMALRRRFKFVSLRPNPERVPQTIKGPGYQVNLREVFTRINDKIEVLLGNEYCLGHSYFDRDAIRNINDLRERWFGQVLPLLQEYLFDDWAKIELIAKPFVQKSQVKGLTDDMWRRTDRFEFVGYEWDDKTFAGAITKLAE